MIAKKASAPSVNRYGSGRARAQRCDALRNRSRLRIRELQEAGVGPRGVLRPPPTLRQLHVVRELEQSVSPCAQPVTFLCSRYIHFPLHPFTTAPSAPADIRATTRLFFEGSLY